MKTVVRMFYYLSVLILMIGCFVLALMSGSESNIINFKNTESVTLLAISILLLVVMVGQLYKKIRPYTLILGLLAFIGLIALNINLKLSSLGYLLVFWIVLVLGANIYLIKLNKY